MKIMNRVLYGILAVSLLPAFAQQPASQTGKIHGQVTNYTGQPQPAGMICLSTDGGFTPAYTFPVDSHGRYSGEAPAGTYTLIFRMPDTPPTLWIDVINFVTITAGKDLEQNDDMSRPEFIKDLPDEQKKQLEDLKKQSAGMQNQDTLVKTINDDMSIAAQELKEADNARSAALKALGRTAEPADVDARATEIRTPKCTDVESRMLKDLELLKQSGLAADETLLWDNLGHAQIGLKKYDDAEKAYKKVLEIQTASGNPKPAVQAEANARLGEIYARTNKTAEAARAFDVAVQLDSAHAGMYLRDEALTFLQTGDAEAQIAAAEKAIAAEPRDASAYYFKANGLFKKAGIDPASKHYDLPPGCAEAYQKYLSLAPVGPYAAEAQSVLRRAEKGTKAAAK
jgi:tetratricopeptide (TPR) repeat protein